MKTIMEQIQEEKEEKLIVEGDFNARTGNEGGPVREEDEKIRETRNSIDRVVNREGRLLVNKIEERGRILNGSFSKKGGCTYIGELGASVVDYVVANEKAEENVQMIKERDRTESDHVPLEVELVGPESNTSRQITKVIEKSNWLEKGIANYRKRCEGWTSTQIENENIWKELKEKVKSSITKKKMLIWRLGKKEWHSKEWKKEKGYLKILRQMKKGKISREEYVRKKKDYKIWCEKERKRHEKEEKEKIKSI